MKAAEKYLAGEIMKSVDASSVKKTNTIYANAQLYLIAHCATEFLKEQSSAGETSATAAIKALDEAREAKNKRVLLPFSRSEFLEWRYLFPAYSKGDQVYLPVNDILYDCIVSCCYRALSAIKKKKSTITIDELIANIKRSYNSKKEK